MMSLPFRFQTATSLWGFEVTRRLRKSQKSSKSQGDQAQSSEFYGLGMKETANIPQMGDIKVPMFS